MCNFYVGQRVVCVDAKGYNSRGDSALLVERSVYTIRSIGLDEENDLVVRLEEISRKPLHFNPRFSEVGFRATRFRPLTDISSLERLLRAETIGEAVDA